MGLSFKQKDGNLSLGDLYSKDYFTSKYYRYVVPFFVLYFASTVVGLYLQALDSFYPAMFIGFLPFWGPGNWFIPVLFQFVIIFPLLYKCFSMKPKLTVFLCFASDLFFQLLYYFIFHDAPAELRLAYRAFILCSIMFYLTAVGFGLWFSKGYEMKSKRNLFIWILLPLSVAYLIAYQFFDFRFEFISGDYNFLVFPYSAFLFLLGMRFLPKNPQGKIAKVISTIGKSTYHILLFQILYFGISYYFFPFYSIEAVGEGFYLLYYVQCAVNFIICIPAGVTLYAFEKKLGELQTRRRYVITEKRVAIPAHPRS